MNPYLQPIPVGSPLPLNNLHAVSVSLPTMADVIGYEENDPGVTGKMRSGYPRFFMNKLVEKLLVYLRKRHRIPEGMEMLPLMSRKALAIAGRKFNTSFEFIEEEGSVFLLTGTDNPRLKEIQEFIKHTGILLSSRKAEDLLFSRGLIPAKQEEDLYEQTGASDAIKTELCQAYDTGSTKNLFLCSSGMNAVYAAFEAIAGLNRNTRRQTILQAGWLYVDTLEIIRKYSNDSIAVTSVTDFARLEEIIVKDFSTIGAVFTEIPNNPLLECPHLPRLHELCMKYGIPLVVDSTIGTAHNLNILPYCDLAIESLTKFACGKGDVLMGAVIVNPAGAFAGAAKELLEPNIIDPYPGDESRLAQNIGGYEERVRVISGNTKRIIEYLSKSPAVKEVYSVLHPKSYENFLKIRKHPDALPGLISVVFEKELACYYDKLNLPKGPSLGTEFTLAMPYVYLAHYDKVKKPAGREELMRMGLHPELLRISIGIEPAGEIIAALQAAGI